MREFVQYESWKKRKLNVLRISENVRLILPVENYEQKKKREITKDIWRSTESHQYNTFNSGNIENSIDLGIYWRVCTRILSNQIIFFKHSNSNYSNFLTHFFIFFRYLKKNFATSRSFSHCPLNSAKWEFAELTEHRDCPNFLLCKKICYLPVKITMLFSQQHHNSYVSYKFENNNNDNINVNFLLLITIIRRRFRAELALFPDFGATSSKT